MKTHTTDTIRRNQQEGGFTLLEVLIATSIFMVGMLAIGSMQTRALLTNSKTRDITQAVNIAMRTAEDLMARDWNDLASGNPINLAGGRQPLGDAVDNAPSRYIIWLTPFPPTAGYAANTAYIRSGSK